MEKAPEYTRPRMRAVGLDAARWIAREGVRHPVFAALAAWVGLNGLAMIYYFLIAFRAVDPSAGTLLDRLRAAWDSDSFQNNVTDVAVLTAAAVTLFLLVCLCVYAKRFRARREAIALMDEAQTLMREGLDELRECRRRAGWSLEMRTHFRAHEGVEATRAAWEGRVLTFVKKDEHLSNGFEMARAEPWLPWKSVPLDPTLDLQRYAANADQIVRWLLWLELAIRHRLPTDDDMIRMELIAKQGAIDFPFDAKKKT